MSYRAPVKDMLFVIKELADIDTVASLPGFEEAGYDTAAAVLEEAAKFSEGVLAPLNWDGDQQPSSWKDGVVTTTPGPHTVLYAMTPTSLTSILELPSSGDCSYPGLYWHDDMLHVTYYSSHEGKAAMEHQILIHPGFREQPVRRRSDEHILDLK